MKKIVEKGQVKYADLQEAFTQVDSKHSLAEYLEEFENDEFLETYRGRYIQTIQYTRLTPYLDYWRLTPRAIVELDAEIRECLDKSGRENNCHKCKRLVLNAIECEGVNVEGEACTARYHLACAKKECMKCGHDLFSQ